MAHHAGKIETSPDLLIVLDLLKKANYPPSSEEMTTLGYNFQVSGRLMLNISEKIGQMRAPINSDRGYKISYSTSWKQAGKHVSPSMRINRDGSVTFFMEQLSEPWHDGRPRYYLVSAPGWTPRWTINSKGLLVPYYAVPTLTSVPQPPAQIDPQGPGPEDTTPRICKNALCGQPLTGEYPWCDAECRAAWRDQLGAGSTPSRKGQP